MSDDNKLIDDEQIVKNKIEYDEHIQKLRQEILKRFAEFRCTMQYMAADGPIEVMCLPRQIEKILIENGFLRIYDLFNRDFTEIKGLGIIRIRDLTSRLDEFFSML